MNEKKDAIAIIEPVKDIVTEQINKAVIEMRRVEDKLKPKTFDMLRYRSGDNGLMLFIYGDHDCNDEDKVIARLKQVIAKYESKKNKAKKLPQPSFMAKLLGK